MDKYLGIFNLFFAGISLAWLASRSKSFSPLKKPISILAKEKRTSTGFLFVLSVFSVLQVLFALVVINCLEVGNTALAQGIFIASSFVLVLASIIPTHESFTVHKTLVQLSVLLVSIGVLILVVALFETNKLLSAVLVTSTLVLPPLSLYLRNKTKVGYWELPVFCLVIIWNTVFTLAIL